MGLSLALGVAAGILWVRSYFVAESLGYMRRHAPMLSSWVNLASMRGLVGVQVVYRNKADWSDPRDTIIGHNQVDFHDPVMLGIVVPFRRSDASWLGFGTSYGSLWPGNFNFKLIVPTWFVVLVLMLGATFFWRRVKKLRLRMRPGFCPGCGYDVRASSDRCPECGRAIKDKIMAC